MDKKTQKVTIATRVGIIFATAGSAVGLGNIWHFPTTCGQSGGAAFILLYLIIMLPLGGLLSLLIVGWVMPRERVMNQLTSNGLHKVYMPLVSVFFILARFICPVLIMIIFLFKMGVI